MRALVVLVAVLAVGCGSPCPELQDACNRCLDPNHKLACESAVDSGNDDTCEAALESYNNICP